MTHEIPTRIGRIEQRPARPQNNIFIWDLSYWGWLDDQERQEFWDWALGPYLPDQESVESIPFLLQRPVASNYGGEANEVCLLVEGPLSAHEYLLIDRYIVYCWHILPRFLEARRRVPRSRLDQASFKRKLVV